MLDAMYKVAEFHKKMGLDIGVDMPTHPLRDLFQTARRLKLESFHLEDSCKKDIRILYSHLLTEESSEFAMAIAQGDEEHAARELVDIIYSAIGFAVAMNWPLVDLFDAVHEANMTKEKLPENEKIGRVRKRGASYCSPDEKIKEIIRNK